MTQGPWPDPLILELWGLLEPENAFSYTIKIFNRVDCCRERLSNFYLMVSDRPFPGPLARAKSQASWSHHFPNQARTEESVNVSHTGRYVRVQLVGRNPLSLAEVQVFGKLSDSALKSPVADKESGYPDGSRLQADYQHFQDKPALPGGTPQDIIQRHPPALKTLADRASQEAELSKGFTLHLLHTMPISRSPVQLGQTIPGRNVDEATRYIVTYNIKYQGIPLSKGSDYTKILGSQGQLLMSRKRGIPLQVDASRPTVSADTAIGVAR